MVFEKKKRKEEVHLYSNKGVNDLRKLLFRDLFID